MISIAKPHQHQHQQQQQHQQQYRTADRMKALTGVGYQLISIKMRAFAELVF